MKAFKLNTQHELGRFKLSKKSEFYSQDRKDMNEIAIVSFIDLCDRFEQIILVRHQEMGNAQLNFLRDIVEKMDSHVFFGKNTVICKAIDMLIQQSNQFEYLKELKQQLVGPLFMLFTNHQDLPQLKSLIDIIQKQGQLKTGEIAKRDIYVEAGNTRIEPYHTHFFQDVGVPTRIRMGTIEVQTSHRIIKSGEPASYSSVWICNRLKMTTKFCNYEVVCVADRSSQCVYPARYLEDQIVVDMERVLMEGANTIACLSSECHLINQASVILSLKSSIWDAMALKKALPDSPEQDTSIF